MSRQYFGTDGIRGTVGISPITPTKKVSIYLFRARLFYVFCDFFNK